MDAASVAIVAASGVVTQVIFIRPMYAWMFLDMSVATTSLAVEHCS